MRKKILHLTAFLFIITSCNNKSDFIFDHVENITVDTIPIQHIFPSPQEMTITGDILTVASYGSGEMLHFYKIPALKYMYSASKKGQGPGEFQAFPMICHNTGSDKLYIWGYTPLTINEWLIHNDSLLLNKTHTLNQYETFNQLHIVHDSLFIYSAIPSDFSIKKYNLNTHKETGKISLKIGDHNQPFFSLDYGFVAATDSCMVYAYNYKKQIDIYDIASLKLKKRLSDNKNYPPPVIGDYDDNVHQYINIVAGKKYFYALYHGKYGKDRTVNGDIIEVFDYNGNPVVKYVFNICPRVFTIDEANNMLYGYSFHYQDYLIKCRLPVNTALQDLK